jgi:hypothetical protein
MEVEFTDYAAMRMHQRDILQDEVQQALASSPSKHRLRTDGRSEVRERIGRKLLLVIYVKRRDVITVVNAMWEN